MILKLAGMLLAMVVEFAGANEKHVHSSPPPSRSQIEACHRTALLLHPGMIDDQQILDRREGYWIKYQIHLFGGAQWRIVCDLSSGGIIHDELLPDKQIG